MEAESKKNRFSPRNNVCIGIIVVLIALTMMVVGSAVLLITLSGMK